MIEYPRTLQNAIELDIVNHHLAVNDLLSADGVVERYQSAQHEAETVLTALERKGLIAKSEKDSFRILGKSASTVNSVFQYSEEMDLKPTSEVRDLNVVPADPKDAAVLGVAVGTPVFKQMRTRFINGEVVANQCNTIPYDVCPGLSQVDLSQRSFQVTLEQDFHAIIGRIEERFFLDAATAEDAQTLNIPPKSTILDARRLSYSCTNFVIVSAELHIRIDRYHYVKALWPQAAYLLHLEN